MIPKGNNINNAERFLGFGDEYNKYRPTAPQTVVEILTNYLGKKPSLVVDLGCGTGLSSLIWMAHADKVIGVEPNNEMRTKAQENLGRSKVLSSIDFIHGYSNQLDIDSHTIDIITCSQSFHWMEPSSTLKEVSRVLRKGGIFAAYDYDWPPTINWKIEAQYKKLAEKASSILDHLVENDKKVRRWNKNEHLKNMEDSKAFRFTKEIVFHNIEKCNAMRYVGLALSQSWLQTIIKLGSTELNDDIQMYKNGVEEHFGEDTLDVLFSYRMRVGVK